MQVLHCSMGISHKQEREPHLSICQFHCGFPRHWSCQTLPCFDHANDSTFFPTSWHARSPNNFGVWYGQAQTMRMCVRDLLEQRGRIIPWCTKLYHCICKHSVICISDTCIGGWARKNSDWKTTEIDDRLQLCVSHHILPVFDWFQDVLDATNEGRSWEDQRV